MNGQSQERKPPPTICKSYRTEVGLRNPDAKMPNRGQSRSKSLRKCSSYVFLLGISQVSAHSLEEEASNEIPEGNFYGTFVPWKSLITAQPESSVLPKCQELWSPKYRGYLLRCLTLRSSRLFVSRCLLLLYLLSRFAFVSVTSERVMCLPRQFSIECGLETRCRIVMKPIKASFPPDPTLSRRIQLLRMAQLTLTWQRPL